MLDFNDFLDIKNDINNKEKQKELAFNEQMQTIGAGEVSSTDVSEAVNDATALMSSLYKYGTIMSEDTKEGKQNLADAYARYDASQAGFGSNFEKAEVNPLIDPLNFVAGGAGQLIGKGVEKAVASNIGKNALKDASLILEDKSIDMAIAKLSGVTADVTAQSAVFAPQSLTGSTFNEQGELQGTYDDTLKGFTEAMGANAMLMATASQLGWSAKLGLEKAKKVKEVNKIWKDENIQLNKANDIANEINNVAFKDNDIKIDKDGFVDANEVNIKGKKEYAIKEMFDEPTSEGYIGKFEIKSDGLGFIRGNITKDGKFIIDKQSSKIKLNAKTLGYEEDGFKRLLFEPVNKAKEYREEIDNAQQYHTYENIMVDDKGNIVKRDGNNFRQYEKSKVVNDDIKDLANGLKDTNKSFDQDIVAQAITNKDYEPPVGSKGQITNSVKEVKSVMKNIDIPEYRTNKEAVIGDNQNIKQKQVYDALYNKEINGNTIKWTNTKPEVNEALKYAMIAVKSSEDTLDKIDKNSVKNAIISKALKILNPKDANNDLVRKELSNIYDETIANKINITKDELGNNIIFNIPKIDKVHIDNIENKISTKVEKETIIPANVKNKLKDNELVKDNFNHDNDIKQLALNEAKKEYIIDNKALESYNKLYDKTKNATIDNPTIEALKYVIPDLADMKNINIVKWYKELPITEKEKIFDAINNFNRSVEYLNNIQKQYPSIPLSFKTKVDSIGRVYYQSEVNPKHKIGRAVFVQKNQVKRFSDLTEDEIITQIRSFLSFFGEKPEKMSDKEVIEKIVDYFDKTDMREIGSWKYDDGFLNKAIFDKFIEFKELLTKNKPQNTNFVMLNEIDGINNGIALTKASLGLKDESLGLGSKVSYAKGTLDIYERFVDNLKDTFDGLKRSDVKTAIIAVFNSASDYETAKAIARTMLDNIVKNINDTSKYKDLFNSLVKDDIDKSIISFLSHIGSNNKTNARKLLNELINATAMLKKEQLAKNDIKFYDDIYNAIRTNKRLDGIQGEISDIFRKKINKKVKDRLKKGESKAKKDAIYNEEFEKVKYDIDNLLKLLETKSSFYNNTILTDTTKEFLLNRFAKRYINDISNAIEKTLGSDIMKYRKSIKEISDIAHMKFAIDFKVKNFNHQQTIKIVEKIGKILDVDDNILKSIKSEISNTKHSIDDILTKVQKYVDLDERIMKLDEIQAIIPKLSGIFGDSNTITFKGYAGYDRANRLNYGKPSPIFTFQPLYTMNMDTHIMSKAIGGSTSLWDAFVGSANDVIDSAKRANEIVGGMYRIDSPNVGSLLLNNLSEFVNHIRYNTKMKKELLNYLSEQSLRSKDLQITKDNIAKAKTKYETLFNDIVQNSKSIKEIEKSLIELRDEIDNNRKKIDDNFVVDQYSNGSKDIISTKDRFEKIERISSNKEFIKYQSVDEALSNVNYSDILDKEADIELNIGYKNFIFSDYKEANIEIGSNSEYANNIIRLSNKLNKFDNNFVNEFIHETVHHIQKVFNEIRGNEPNHLYEFLSVLMHQGRITKNGIPLGSKDLNEVTSILLGKLISNNLYKANPKIFAKAFEDKNLYKLIQENSFEIDGKKVETVNDLKDAIEQLIIDDDKRLNTSIEFDNIVKNSYLLTSKNDIFLAKLNKINFKDELTTIDDISTFGLLVEKARSGIDKQLGNIGDKLIQLDTFEFLELSQQKEIVESALAIKNGFDNELETHSSMFAKKLKDVLAKYNMDEFADRAIGNAIMIGIHLFDRDLSKFKTSREFIDYIKDTSNKEFKSLMDYATKNGIVNELIDLEHKITNAVYDGKSLQNAINRFANAVASNDRTKLNDVRLRLNRYAKRRAVFYKLFGYIDSKRGIRGYDDNLGIIITRANERSSAMANSVGKIFREVKKNKDFNKVYNIFTSLHDKYANTSTLFGENPHLALNNESLYAIPAKGAKKPNKAIGKIVVDGKLYLVYAKDSINYTLGKQESNIIYFSKNKTFDGVYKVKIKGMKGYVELNPTQMNTRNNYIDNRATTQLRRNYYSKLYNDSAEKLAFMQFKKFKDAGAFLTNDEYNALPLNEKEYYTKMPTKHPFTAIGGYRYIKTKYKHYVLGTKGIDYSKGFKKIFGKRGGKYVSNVLKTITGLTNDLKQTVLVAHISSHINNFVANQIIAHTHIGREAGVYQLEAKKLFDEYKDISNKMTEALVNGDNASFYRYKSQLEKHSIHNAFKNGIASTIRSSAYELGTYEDSFITSRLQKQFDKRLALAYKYMMFDPSTPHGNYLGNVFDNTEIIPKLALYLYELERTNNEQLATKKVLMAFPTYNNLNQLFAIVDEFSPYVKYVINIPKMLRYANALNPIRNTIATFMLPSLQTYSWEPDDEKKYKWYIEHGFSEVIDNEYGWFTNNLFPFNIPVDFGDDDLMSYIFAYNVIEKASFLPDINPLTQLEPNR